MQLQINQLVTLSDDDLKSACENLEGFKPNGKAILVGTNTELNIYKDLFLFANAGIRSSFKNMSVKKYPFQKDDEKLVDDQSREFLIRLASFNESLFNSSSIKKENFNGLEDFDKMELKDKLQRIVDIL
jgi:hypothetical protein